MKMKKLSVKALMFLILSAILFCMPVGAFFANRANTVEVHEEDTAEQKAQRPVMITRTVPVVEKITQSSPQRIQRKIPQKAQLRRHSLPQNAPARKNAVSMQ